MSAPSIVRENWNRAVDVCLPAERQPVWRRGMFVMLCTAVIALIVPAPAVVSDVTHTAVGFDSLPERKQLPQAAGRARAVWQVEETGSHELYSNGLRIETGATIRNQQRFYQVLDRTADLRPSLEWYSRPAGIVFHTTESPQAPFEQEQSAALQRIGKALLTHVQINRSYHYLIDRFGRVHRVVDELDAANHAGNSVWARGRDLYLNLNSSFLGVSFEAAGDAQLSTAQVFAGRLLTEMLRSRYEIPPENCVAHAQVSVNPTNLKIGYHTDGARAFPFVELGLGQNYDLPLAAVTDFGFTYDEAFQKAIGKPWRGLILAENLLEERAAYLRRPIPEHRSALQAKYQRLFSDFKASRALDEEER